MDLRGDATHKIYGICFEFLQKHICEDPLTLICNNFMRFVLQNPIVRSQSLDFVEPKFKAAYDGS